MIGHSPLLAPACVDGWVSATRTRNPREGQLSAGANAFLCDIESGAGVVIHLS